MQQMDMVAVAVDRAFHAQQKALVLNHRSRGGDGGGASDDDASSHHPSHHPTKWQQEKVRIGDILFYF